MNRVPLSLSLLDGLDLGLKAVLETAQLADDLSFKRYWLAQHIDGRFALNPVIVSSMIAGTTERLRVGAAGVLLRYFAPRAVVADAITLGNLFPGRVDVGLAAGFVDAAEVALDLADGRVGLESDAYFNQKVREVSLTLQECVAAQPAADAATDEDFPALWVLGGSGNRARLAGENGLRYCLSLCHSAKSVPPPSVLTAYREAFRPSPGLRQPSCSVHVLLTCAETEAEAKATAARIDQAFPIIAVGVDRVSDTLREIGERYGVDEIVIRDASPDFETRRRSLEFLAGAIMAPKSDASAHDR